MSIYTEQYDSLIRFFHEKDPARTQTATKLARQHQLELERLIRDEPDLYKRTVAEEADRLCPYHFRLADDRACTQALRRARHGGFLHGFLFALFLFGLFAALNGMYQRRAQDTASLSPSYFDEITRQGYFLPPDEQ